MCFNKSPFTHTTMNRVLALLLVLFFISCTRRADKKPQTSADSVRVARIKNVGVIPRELKEISGISFVNDSVVVAVQDETGVLYFYDVYKKAIVRQYPFAKAGDYEDVAVAGNTVYIVNSSGTIFRIDNFRTKPSPVIRYDTPLTEKNNIEGLAWDKRNNRLLLAAKDDGLGHPTDKEIYTFDVATGKLDTTPAYSIRLKDIEAFFTGDELEEASKKFLKVLGNNKLTQVFRTSAIAVHPTTGELYVLTSLNNMIAVLSADGSVRRIIELTGRDHSQPEGLAFTSDARLFVSNESNGRKANIIEITYD